MKTIIVRNEQKYIELPFGRALAFDSSLNVTEGGVYRTRLNENEAYICDVKSSVDEVCIDEDIYAKVFEGETRFYEVEASVQIHIGKMDIDDIVIENASAQCLIYADRFTILSGYAYLNGNRKDEGVYELRRGDCIYLSAIKIFYQKDKVECEGIIYTSKLREALKIYGIGEEYPQYMRSPRIIKREPQDIIEIKQPPTKPLKSKGAWLTILTPLLMVCITIAIGVIMKRGWMMLISATMMVASAVFAVVRVVSDKKIVRQKELTRVEKYNTYLLRTRKSLDALYQEQRESLLFHYPTITQIAKMITERSGRIYERALNDADFLTISVGRTSIAPSYILKANRDILVEQYDELHKQMEEVASNFTTVRDVPNVIDLKHSHMAIVGEKDQVQQQLLAIIANMSFFQSYHDLCIVLLTDEESKSRFEWMRWLPHCRLSTINTLTIISTESQRDKVLGNIASQLKERRMNKDTYKNNGLYYPHFVFIIDNPKLIISHSIMEHLQEQEADIGASIIYCTNQILNVLENIKTVVTLDSREHATLVMKEGQYINRPISLESFYDIDFETISRGLCPIVHNKGISTQIPDELTFFQMYDIKNPSELPIQRLWEESASNKSLSVPLGARGENDYVYLNLHEKAHGPHGLIAGTTGSGKSEAIQTYILSLAVNFHPYDVGFLLIDYKGGGMAKLFERLPHLLGIITNLDTSESMRALTSIRSELERRQRIFNDEGVNNINDYTKLFKAKKVTEPLPHLFIISDEFAELKKEQPDFMKALVSTARIGRSLGVHLILATQKPTGVVDDQIWSNSRFKLALKVQDESDSNEILKTPDAARITQVGRAYLQIGNNEIYELFQTAYSGASYFKRDAIRAYDERIFIENDSGQGTLLNTDLGDVESDSDSMVTQLDATVEYISYLYKQLNVPDVRKPWLPPLNDMLLTPHIFVDMDVAIFDRIDIVAPLGIVDIPRNQEQVEYVHDFMVDGNLAFFGASGYGKSVAMMNVSLQLASKNSPTMVHLYILDFGSSSLVQLKGLPHTAEYMTIDDTEKLAKFMSLLQDEISLRKRLFAKENAVSFRMYNQTVQVKLPAIIIEVDNYDVVKESQSGMDSFIQTTSRDGSSLGIYMMISASRANVVRYNTLNNFKTKVAFYSFDASDYSDAVGRSDYRLPEVRGRAFVKLKEPHVMQGYLPTACDNEIDYAEKIHEIVESIATKNTAREAEGIRVLPEVVYQYMLEPSDDHMMVPIGIEANEVVTQYLNLSEKIQLIIGPPQTGKTNLLRVILNQMDKGHIFLADSPNLELVEYFDKPNVTMLNDIESFVLELERTLNSRQDEYEASDKLLVPRLFYQTLSPIVLIIDDVDFFIETIRPIASKVEEQLGRFANLGVSIVATTIPSKLRGYDNITKLIRTAQAGIVLGNPIEQSIFSITPQRSFKEKVDIGFVVQRGSSLKVMIPKG